MKIINRHIGEVGSVETLMTIAHNYHQSPLNKEDFPHLTCFMSTNLRYKAFINFRQDTTQQTQSGQSQNNH